MAAIKPAIDFLCTKGWTSAQACGIVANLVAESGLRVDALGDGGQAYGIAQWHPDRQANFARQFGKEIQGSSLEEQLAFVDWELRNTEKRAGGRLQNCVTADAAAAVVCREYERPLDKDGEAAKRSAAAMRLFAEYSPMTPPIEAPIEPRTDPRPRMKEASMPILALISAFGPILSSLIPQLATIFAPKGEVGQRNLKIAEVALNTITAAAGATNVQDAVEKLQADPALVKTVTEAVVTQPDIMVALTLPADAEKAVERSIVMQNAERPFWYNPLVWVTFAFFPMMYMITAATLFLTNAGLSPDGTIALNSQWWSIVGFDPSTRSGLVNLIVGMVFGGVAGVWFGTSVNAQKQAAAAKPQ